MASDEHEHVRLRLRVITPAEAEARGFIAAAGMQGDPAVPVSMCCGECDHEITRGIQVGQLINSVLRCHSCGAFNEVLGGT